jgi:hypothetical protein
MKLFDKLEECVHDLQVKHNKLSSMAGKDMDELEGKLRELQSKIEHINSNKPKTVQAFSTNPANPARVHSSQYPYLPRPQVEISPDGRIKITFAQEWTDLERENFLHDLRAKTVKK